MHRVENELWSAAETAFAVLVTCCLVRVDLMRSAKQNPGIASIAQYDVGLFSQFRFLFPVCAARAVDNQLLN
jgi:hypothetical protein